MHPNTLIQLQCEDLIKEIKTETVGWPTKLGELCLKLNQIQHPIWLTATRIVGNSKLPLEDRRLGVLKLWENWNNENL